MENATKAATPETTDAAPEAEQVVEEPFVARNKTWKAATAIQKKGKGAGKSRTVLVPNNPADVNQFLNAVKETVGEANYNTLILKEVIRPASYDAQRDAEAASEKAGKEGEFSYEEWFEKFCEQFLPGARRSGEGIKQIRERLAAVMKEMEPLMQRHLKKETRDQMKPEEVSRLLQLMAEFSELSEKEEGKSRKGKKGAAAPAPAAKAA